MRAALLVLLLVAPLAAADEPYVVLLDWTDGASLVGTTAYLSAPDAAAFAFETDECHRLLLLDLLYEPDETVVSVDGVGSVALVHEFRAESRTNGSLDGAARIRHSGYGTPVALVEEGAHELRVWLATGAHIDWQLRLRARNVGDEPGCSSPV